MADLCYGCMKDTHGEKICPHCGFSQDTEQYSPFLPLGASLENDRYTVGKMLDNRSDSVRYIGYDKKTEKIVCIREFLPEGLFSRSENSMAVTVNKGCGKKFNALKQRFTKCYQTVMDMSDNDSIVKIENIFQDNNTVYAVEEKEATIAFEEYVKRSGGHLDWEVLRPLVKPLLEGMVQLEEKEVHHLGICPDNIVVTADGKLKLTGFAMSTVRQKGRSLPPQLFSGCSAPEQYDEDGELDTATDIYAFCATLFFAVTGQLPVDAVKRKEDGRLLMSTSVAKKLPPFVIKTLAKGLQTEKSERIHSFKDLAEQLSATPTVKAMQNEISKTVDFTPEGDKTNAKQMSNFKMGVIAMMIALVVFGGLGYLWYRTYPLDGMFDVEHTTESSTNPENLPEDSTYSADSEYFRVPDFIGKTWDEAKAISLNSEEYSIYKAIEEDFSDTVPQGQICKQTPDAKKTVSRGNDGVSITCTISKGAQYRELPKVANVNKDVATESLVSQSFIVNSTLGYSDTIPAGNVIGYSGNIKEGDKQEYGSVVTINVSLGKKPEQATEQSFTYVDETRPVQ